MEKINVVWIGAEGFVLPKLMNAVNERLDHIRHNEHEEVPHLTIARVKSGRGREEMKKWLNKNKDKDFGKMLVDKFFLYESELTAEGPKYKIVKSFNLG